jgi:hypothetical protein
MPDVSEEQRQGVRVPFLHSVRFADHGSAALHWRTMSARAPGWIALLAGSLVPAQDAQQPALRGLDPVALCGGSEVAGDAERTVQHGDFTYRFASDQTRAAFLADTDRFAIQMNGSCARMGPLLGPGSPQRFLVHGGRIYVFASDECRDTFSRQPDFFLDPDVPEPAGDAKARADGAQLLARALAAHGGEARLREWRTYRHETAPQAVGGGDAAGTVRLHLLLPGSARIEYEHSLSGRQVRFDAHVVAPANAFFVERDTRRPMGAAARREVERRLQHEPVWALRQVLAAPHVAVARGTRTVARAQVDELELWQRGGTTTFGVGADGRIRSARFRGRGPSWAFGTIELVFDDFRTVGGLVVPGTVNGTFNGVAMAAFVERRDTIEVDAELRADLFAAPK